MSVLNQKTIKKPISFEGVALHSGKVIHIEIKPSEPIPNFLSQRHFIKSLFLLGKESLLLLIIIKSFPVP